MNWAYEGDETQALAEAFGYIPVVPQKAIVKILGTMISSYSNSAIRSSNSFAVSKDFAALSPTMISLMLSFFPLSISLLLLMPLCEHYLALLVTDRSIFSRVDYSLLLTFVGFLSSLVISGDFRHFLKCCSRSSPGMRSWPALPPARISNVPAVLLLSGFTKDLSTLIIGVNLGGLGTLVASMASTISYELIARKESQI